MTEQPAHLKNSWMTKVAAVLASDADKTAIVRAA
jgi:hypothetical protein